MESVQHVLLQPPVAVVPGQSTLLHARFSPTGNGVVLAAGPANAISSPAPRPKQRQLVYMAHYSQQPYERRAFHVDTYTVYASLQKIVAEQERSAVPSMYSSHDTQLPPPSPEYVSYLNRIMGLYKQAAVAQLPLIQSDTTETSESHKAHALSHHAALHSTLSLVEILYAPFDGRGEGVVGEEILDWVNTVDRAPSAEEGEELADLARPWEHPNFWPYVYRCILRAHLLSANALLTLLSSSHSSTALRSLASLAVSLIETFPRSTSTKFPTEQSYLSATRTWRTRTRNALKNQVEDGYASFESEGDMDEDARIDWEAAFRCLFELLAGEEQRILEASEDWREALGAWGVWVNGGGRREGLPDLLELVQKSHPVDRTLPSESVQAALFAGDVARALQQANLISSWLVAHLADLFTHLQLVDLSPPDDSTPSLRSHFVMQYATDTLGTDPSLWRIAVDYLASCGAEGRARMSHILTHVGLNEPAVGKAAVNGTAPEDEHASDESSRATSRTVQDVLRACAEQGLEDEMVSICKAYSETLVSNKRFGEAISFCIRAGDQKRIARIADRVLAEYVNNGQDAFVRHVDSIPTSLLRPSGPSLRAELFPGEADDDDVEDEDMEGVPTVPFGMHSTRLTFLARYRDFFASYARGERRQSAGLLVALLSSNLAPKGFVAVMLLDAIALLEDPEPVVSLEETYELMRVLEDLTAPISACGSDINGHLDSLATVLGAAETDSRIDRTRRAMKELEVVRGALARNLARCYCL